MIAQNHARILFKRGVIITMDPAVSNLAIGTCWWKATGLSPSARTSRRTVPR
jgi:hypothetical protein